MRGFRSSRTGVVATSMLLVVAVACGGGGGSKAASSSSSSKPGALGGPTGGAAGAYVPTGPLIADNGFRPEKDGFAFENYGQPHPNKDLTPVEVRRIFGDQVCATIQGADCLLSPPAQQWLESSNKIMDGGHCYGFSVAALEMFTGTVPVNSFGADATPALGLPNNDPLQREIAYAFIQQMFDSVQGAIVKGTPAEVLDKLIETLKAPKDVAEAYTIGFYQRAGGGGHAVTPFAVEDKGDNKFAVLIWDNNHPTITRAIQIDKTANTWNYEAATNPNEPASGYEGDATTQSIVLMPMRPALGQQPCPFCRPPGGTGGALGGQATSQPVGFSNAAQAPSTLFNEVTLEGSPGNHGHVVIFDSQGRRTGIVDGKRVAEIPGVQTVTSLAGDVWDEAVEPVYRVPLNLDFTITIDGSALKSTDVTNVLMTGPGYDLAIDSLNLDPGQVDTLKVSPDGTHLTYATTQSESPTIIIGVDGANNDHAFAFKGVDIEGGGSVDAVIDNAAGTVTLSAPGTTKAGQYLILMDLFTPDKEFIFSHDNIELQPGDTATLQFGAWQKDGDTIPLTVTGPGGSPNTIQLSDEGG